MANMTTGFRTVRGLRKAREATGTLSVEIAVPYGISILVRNADDRYQQLRLSTTEAEALAARLQSAVDTVRGK